MKLSWKIGLIIGLMVIMSMATIGTSNAAIGINQAAAVSPNLNSTQSIAELATRHNPL